jgi:hypothetical protein
MILLHHSVGWLCPSHIKSHSQPAYAIIFLLLYSAFFHCSTACPLEAALSLHY